MERDHLSSRLGFILLSAGCAIGCGNVWKFPWLAGEYGGGAFVLFYIFFLVILGLPVMVMEFAVGRASQRSPVLMHKVLVPNEKKWRVHSAMCLVGNFTLLMFYSVVTGWMFYYFVTMATGGMKAMPTFGYEQQFGNLLASAQTLIAYTSVTVIFGFLVLSFSLRRGLERVTKWMMIALLLLMIVMAGHSFALEGCHRGLEFYLKPDFSKVNLDLIVAAMNQAFFTLSLGMGGMAIFGSYIGKERALAGESMRVIALDTFVALMAGFIIFPACYTYNVTPSAGPGLLFITLPNVFLHMAYGQFWGSVFFLFMAFAAFSTILGVSEAIQACVMDLTGWSRKKAAFRCCLLMLVLCLPCALGFNVWSSFEPLGKGTCVLDLEDFIVANLILPAGSLAFVFFCTRKSGFTWERFTKEANTGRGMRFADKWRFYCTHILPLVIGTLICLGLIPVIERAFG